MVERQRTGMSDELKLDEDIARSLPGGVIDYATFEAIEEALDRANAPMTEGERFLTLKERIDALGAQRSEAIDVLSELLHEDSDKSDEARIRTRLRGLTAIAKARA